MFIHQNLQMIGHKLKLYIHTYIETYIVWSIALTYHLRFE